MPMTKCAVSYCRNKIPLGNKYCEQHQGSGNKEYNKRVRYSKPNSKYSKFYHTPEWRKTRLAKLSETPYCEVCARNGRTTQATIVHHTTEIRTTEGWEHRLDMNYLESICQTCHNKEPHSNSYKNRNRNKY